MGKLRTIVNKYISGAADEETNELERVQREIENSKYRLAAVGQDADTSSFNPLSTLLKVLVRPGYAGMNTIREFTDPSAGATPDDFDPGTAFLRGLVGEESPTGKEVAISLGFSDQPLFSTSVGGVDISPSPAGIAGFAGEVLNPLDILNWLAPGVGKAGKWGSQAVTKGMPLLEKTFGREVAEELVSKLGVDSKGNYNKWLEGLGSLTREGNPSIPTVGTLVDQIAMRANSMGIEKGINPEAISQLLVDTMQKRGLTAASRAQEYPKYALKFGMNVPFTNKQLFRPVDIPGTQTVASVLSKLGNKVMSTPFGQALGTSFSTKFAPDSVPNSVWTSLLRSGAERPKVDLEVLNNMQGLPGWELMEGKEAYKQVKEGMISMKSVSTEREQRFQEVVDEAFKGTTDQERKDILRAAIYPDVEVAPHLQVPLQLFKDWRTQVSKDYASLGVTFTPLEDYVPFIPVGKPLTKSEAQLLKGIFGTGIKKLQQGDMLDLLKGADSSLLPRTTRAVDPASINQLLGREWLTEDAAVAMARRGIKAIRGQEATKFLQDMAEKFGFEVEDIGSLKHLPEGYVVITPRPESSGRVVLDPLKSIEDRAIILPEEFVKAYNEYTDLMFHPEAQAKMLKFLDQSTRAYKTLAYMWNPGHIPRDMMSNIFNLWLMGVRNPASYMDGMEVMRTASQILKSKPLEQRVSEAGIDVSELKVENEIVLANRTDVPEVLRDAEKVIKKEGKATISLLEKRLGLSIPEARQALRTLTDMGILSKNDKGLWDIVGGPPSGIFAPVNLPPNFTEKMYSFPKWQGSASELYKALEMTGLVDSGSVLNEFLQAGSDWSFRMAPKGKLGKPIAAYTELMRKLTRINDNWARVSGAIDELKRGATLEQAVAKTKKFLFDYNDLTPFEQKFMKRVIPFYTWMRKNIPLQIEQLFKQPGKFATMAKIQNNLGTTPTEEDAPDFIKDQGGFLLGGKGGQGGTYIIPNLSYADIGKIPMSVKGLRELLANTNPLLRAPVEMAANTQLFSGQPLEQYPGEREQFPLNYLLERLGIVDKGQGPTIPSRTVGYLLNQIPQLRTMSTISNPDNPRQVARLVSILGGPQVYPQQWAKEAATYETRDKLRGQIRATEDRGIEVPTLRELLTSTKFKLKDPKNTKKSDTRKAVEKYLK